MKTKQTVLPMLAIVASIAITLLPTALAIEDEFSTIVEMRAQIVGINGYITSIETSNIAHQAIINQMESRNVDYLSAIDTYVSQANSKKAKIAELESSIAALGVVADDSNVRHMHLINQHSAAILQNQADIDFVLGQIGTLRSQMDLNDRQIIQRENIIGEHNNMIVKYKARIAHIQSIIDERSA